MDPQAAYEKLCRFFDTEGPFIVDYREARELWAAFDGWMRRGGFGPSAWTMGGPGVTADAVDVAGMLAAADALGPRGYEILAEELRFAAESIAEAAGVSLR
ncbi:hypothetical protein ABQF26_05310 [Mycolicibacterium elephantis]